ncbi:hypothetical protein EOD08_38165, partial [Mesorhizobium sp. M6A.T.Ca.TU.002.02.2.1]
MPRDRQHFILNNVAVRHEFKPKGGGSANHPSDVADRAGHAQALLQALDHLPDVKAQELPGVYLEVEGRAGEPMITSGLNASDLTLLRVEPARPAANQPQRATVFATDDGLAKLRRKVDDFAQKDRKSGRPYNADLV